MLQFIIDIESQAPSISPINNLGLFISRILNIALILGSILFMLYFVMGAIKWLTSSGDKDKLEEARAAITQATIGLAILATSWAIFLLIEFFFGLNILGESSQAGPSTTSSGSGSSSSNTLAACNCGGAGGCAYNGQIGPLNATGTECYVCRDSGWQLTGGTNCPPITCAACP